jgi:hypothetical protein
MSSAMAALGVSLGPQTPETLSKEVGHLPDVVRELELSTARRAVHRILAMIESHYQGLDRMALSSGWAPDISDDQCDELEVDCAAFAREIAATRRVGGSRSSRALELNMPQTICNNLNTLPGYRVARLLIWRYLSITSECPRTTTAMRSQT